VEGALDGESEDGDDDEDVKAGADLKANGQTSTGEQHPNDDA